MMKKIKEDSNVFFLGENLPMKVMAISEKFAICSRKLDKTEDDDLLGFEVQRSAYFTKEEAYENVKDSPVYTILDFENKLRGTDNYVLGMYDYSKKTDCLKALEDLESDSNMELSRRNTYPLNIDWDKILLGE